MNNQRQSKIVLLVPYAPPYKAGGGLSALRFAIYLNKHGYNTKILTFNRNNTLDKVSYYQGTEVKRISYYNKKLLYKLWSLLIIIPAFVYEIVKTNVLVIYGGYIIGWELMVLIGRLFGKRIIFRSTMLHEDDIDSILINRNILYPIRLIALKNITNYWSLNPKFSEIYIQRIKKPGKVILAPQGVDAGKFQSCSLETKANLREKLGLPADIPIIISLGILSRRKGYPEIFETLSKISTQFLYVIMGDYSLVGGHHKNTAIKQASLLYNSGLNSLADKIRFIGYVNNVGEYLKAADIFLTCSKKEGFPNALLEAMASGLPTVIKNNTYIEDYFLKHNGNCLICNNKTELLLEIQKLISDSSLRMQIGEAALDTIHSGYSYKHIVAKLKL